MPTGVFINDYVLKFILLVPTSKCHMTDPARKHAERRTKSVLCIIPGGLSSLLQPADVSWNKPSKTAYRELYSERMATGQKSFTAAGNTKAPDKLLFNDDCFIAS